MFADRAYSKSITLAVALLAAELGVAVPMIVDAASASGDASVEVVSSPSTLGALSSFEIDLPQNTPINTLIDVSPDTLETARGFEDNGISRMRPALFSISGVPDQTFSIIVPQPGAARSGQGNIEFVGFEHNAGLTPTIGADGTAVFAVGAQVKIDEPAELDFTTNETADGETAITPDKPATPAEQVGMPKINPFGIQSVANGFLNVLVSYN